MVSDGLSCFVPPKSFSLSGRQTWIGAFLAGLYSLRHTYSTMRLAEGVSVFQLAANMGTSVEMLEDFYGKKRMRDPKMATEVTKNRRTYAS
jgi:hypothetical protein